MNEYAPEKFPLLDALRGVGLLMVLGYHMIYQLGATEPEAIRLLYATGLQDVINHWDVGVPIYLLMSGFLLYRPFVRARWHGQPMPSLRGYGIRRLLRIVPGYWVALTVVAIWLGLGEVFTASGIVTFYGFAQIYDGDTAIKGIGQAWTLGTEVAYYAFLPLWVIWMATRPPAPPRRMLRREMLGVGALILFGLAWKAWALKTRVDAAGGDNSQLPYLLPLPAYIDHVAIGMGLAVLSVHWAKHGGVPRPIRALSRRPGLAWGAAAVLWMWLSYGMGLQGEYATDDNKPIYLSDPDYQIRHVVNIVIAACLVAPAIFGDQSRGVLRRVLAFRPLLFLGVISYGVYLYHLAVYRQLADWGVLPVTDYPSYIGFWLLGLIVSVGIASLSWYLLERPIMRLGRRIAPREGRARPPAAPRLDAAS